MTNDLMIALFSFAFASVITPGPNNLMLMASGANFGFRRTLPHMLGVGLGFPIMVLCVGFGVSRIFEIWPASQTILTVVSVLYLLWLAWKIATATAPKDGTTSTNPLSFLQAAAFQWVNPKAWFMASSAITLFAKGGHFTETCLVAFSYAACGVISTTSWTTMGQALRRLLQRPRLLRGFNVAMALLLVGSMAPAVLEALGGPSMLATNH